MEDDLVPAARSALSNAQSVAGELHDAAVERSGLHDLTTYDEVMGHIEDALDALEKARRELGVIIDDIIEGEELHDN